MNKNLFREIHSSPNEAAERRKKRIKPPRNETKRKTKQEEKQKERKERKKKRKKKRANNNVGHIEKGRKRANNQGKR